MTFLSVTQLNSNEISNAFNEHFSTIGPRLAREIPLTSDEESINNITENYNKFCFRPTTTSDVFSHLNRLSKTKATGLDNISARLIRESADIIPGPLCDLFNKADEHRLCLPTGRFSKNNTALIFALSSDRYDAQNLFLIDSSNQMIQVMVRYWTMQT